MSPLWQDEVAIGVAPGRIELVRWSRGLKPVLAEAQVVLPAGTGEDTPAQMRPARQGASGAGEVADHRGSERAGAGARWQNWGEAVAALAHALSEPRWQRARARVVISSHYTRFALVEGAAELAREDERAAFVDLRLRAIYGERADDWQLACTPFSGSGRAVACAIDRGLLEALRECTAAARVSLASAQPYLVAAFNAAADAVRGERVWFVAVEEGRIAMAAFAHDQWVGVHSEPVGRDVAESIASMLAQDALLREAADGECRAYVCAPRWLGRLVAPGPGWTMHRVVQTVPETHAAIATGRVFDATEYPLTAATQRKA